MVFSGITKCCIGGRRLNPFFYSFTQLHIQFSFRISLHLTMLFLVTLPTSHKTLSGLALNICWLQEIHQCIIGHWSYYIGGHHGIDRMVVGFTTTCAVSAYHH